MTLDDLAIELGQLRDEVTGLQEEVRDLRRELERQETNTAAFAKEAEQFVIKLAQCWRTAY